MKNNKNTTYLLSAAIVIVIVTIYFINTRNNVSAPTVLPTTSATPAITQTFDKTIILSGTVKKLNPSTPAEYSYELILDKPFYDELQASGKPDVSKMPILSMDKAFQESIKDFVNRQVIAEGSMAWGLAESRYLSVNAMVDLSGWTTYTNKTFGYNFKLPATYTVPPQTTKEASQLGVDNNISVRKISDTSGSSVIIVDVSQDTNNLSLTDYMKNNAKMFGIDGPLVSYNFNGYAALLNKNQPGTNVFVKNGNNIYHITASTASQDKEVSNIVSTFAFTK